MVMNLVTPLKGVQPIMPGFHNDPAHSDPLASAEMGLKWAPKIGAGDAKRLAKLAAERTLLTSSGSATKAVERVIAAYKDGSLRSLGLASDVDVAELPPEKVALLGRIVGDVFEGAVAFEHEFDFYEHGSSWDSIARSCAHLNDHGKVIASVQSTLRHEHVPSIAALILRGIIRNADIVDIRQRPETIEYRKWLWSQSDPSNAKAVSEAYLAAMAPKVDFRDAGWFKAVRIAVVGVVGAAAGAALGPAAGVAATVAAGVAVSEADGFWLDRLLKKTNPRHFATNVLAPIVAKHQAAVGNVAEGPARVYRQDADVSATATTVATGARQAIIGARVQSTPEQTRKNRNKEKKRRQRQRDARRKSRR
jgi:hypothetical protein